MLTQIILIASTLLQFVVAFLALRLIKVTGNKISWISIVIAICFMAIVRIIILANIISGNIIAPNLTFLIILGFLTSVFMVIGVAGIDKIFRASQATLNEFKKVEKALRKNEERLQMVLDSTSDGFFDWDLKTDSIYFSPRYFTMLGYEPYELSSNTDLRRSLIHPDDIDDVEKIVHDYINGKRPDFSCEFRMKTKTEEWYWIQSRGKIVEFDDKGKPARMVGTHMYINERKLTEQKLHSTLERLAKSEESLRLKLDYIFSPDVHVEEGMTLTDLFDREYLQEIQDAFAYANEVASLITDTEGNPITNPSNFSPVCKIVRSTKEGLKRCILSDKKLGEKAMRLMMPTYEKCHSCGFADASAPIIVGGRHIANWLIGQVNPMKIDEEQIVQYAQEIETDKDKMLNAFRAMPNMTFDRFEKVLELLWILAKELSTMGYNNFKLTRELEQRKQTEKLLLENERKYRSLLDNLPGVAYRSLNTPDWPMEFMSEGCMGLLGIDSKQIVQEHISFNDYIHHDDRQMVWNQVQESLEKHKSYVLEYRLCHIDGSERWVWEKGHGIYDEEGILVALEGFITDISKRKIAEIELSGAAERYKALVAASNTGAWEYHKDTKFMWCSPEYFTMLGRDINEYDVSGKMNIEEIWINLIHPDDMERARQYFNNYIKNPEGMYENRFRMLHKDGHWVPIWSRGRTVRDKDGNVTDRTIGTHIDVSNFKQ